MTGYLFDDTPSDMEVDDDYYTNPNFRGWDFPASSCASPVHLAPNVNCHSSAASSTGASPMHVDSTWHDNPNFRGWHFPASSTGASPMEIDKTWNSTWLGTYSNVCWDPTSLYTSPILVDYTWPWKVPALR